MELRKIKIKINKKGSIEDLFFFIVTMLGLALFIIIIAKVVPDVITEMEKTEMNNTAAIRSIFSQSQTQIIDRLDPVYLIIFAGLIMSIFIVSFMIHSHPIFIPIYIILMGLVVTVGVIANHVYDTFAANVDVSAVAASQTFMVTIWDNFIIILLGVGVISMIIIFAKPFQSTRV